MLFENDLRWDEGIDSSVGVGVCVSVGEPSGDCIHHESEAAETRSVDKFNQTVSSLTSKSLGLYKKKRLTGAYVYAENTVPPKPVIYQSFLDTETFSVSKN